MAVVNAILLCLLLCFISTTHGMGFPQSDPALRCTGHPAYQSSLKPVIVSSWTLPLSEIDFENVAYLARYDKHVYAPVTDLSSRKYRGLDFFHMANRRRVSAFTINFQRPATLYLFVDVPSSSFDASKKLSLIGWKDEGWAKLVQGQEKIVYGVHQTVERKMTKYAYVFSRKTTNSGRKGDRILTVQTDFVAAKLNSVNAPGSYNLWIAEGDGKPSPPVGAFRGTIIQPNTRCPDKLHDVWVTQDNNPNDMDTRGVNFATWHPAWDPCWWCAYDHEHGSSPKDLMGYVPKFTYTAFKNKRQNESAVGFKGIVARTQKYLVYFSIHVSQSTLRRVKTRFHTINMAVVDSKTKKLLMDIQHKGDFGFQSVRLAGTGNRFRPIDAEEQAIEDEQETKDLPKNFRSINVLDPDNPNTAEFQIRKPFLVGQYEQWQTLPMCAKAARRHKLIEMTFKNPNNGIKALNKQNVEVALGRFTKQSPTKFIKSTGANRALITTGVTFASRYCPGGSKGYFYTDADGKKVMSGPGPDSVRQFIADGFEFDFKGRFDVVDKWTGLHTQGSRGFFSDYGYGLNPKVN